MRMDRRSRPPCPKEETIYSQCHGVGKASPESILPVANDKATFTGEKGKGSPQAGSKRLRQRDTQFQAAPVLPKAAKGPRD